MRAAARRSVAHVASGSCVRGASASLTNVPEHSTEAALRRLWRWMRAGSFSNAATLYDHKIIAKLGSSDLVAALRSRRGAFLAGSPAIDSTEKTQLGTLVIVKIGTGKQAKPGSYVLRRNSRGGWIIAYDSILADAVGAQVQLRTQARIAPNKTRPTPQAIAAGREAVRKFDNIFAPRPRLPG